MSTPISETMHLQDALRSSTRRTLEFFRQGALKANPFPQPDPERRDHRPPGPIDRPQPKLL